MKKFVASPAMLLAVLVLKCQSCLGSALDANPRMRIGRMRIGRMRIGMIRRSSWRLGPLAANATGKPMGNPWAAVGGSTNQGAGANDGERGDVPGWVMITLMSAILVAGLLAIALPALQGMFSDAMKQIKP